MQELLIKSVYIALSFFYIFFLPGFLISRLLRLKNLLQVIGLSITLSMTIVGTISILSVLLLNKFVSVFSVFLIATILNVILFSICLKKRNLSYRLDKPNFKLILFFALIFLFFLLRYDISLFEWRFSCLPDSIDKVVGIHDVIEIQPGRFGDAVDNPMGNLYRNGNSTVDNQRLGNTALISPFVALYNLLGLRIFYGMMLLLIALFGFLVMQELTKKKLVQFLSVLVFTLNPFIMAIPIVNENLIALVLMLAMIYTAIKKLNPLVLGFLYGVLCGVRDVSILFSPAIFYVIHWHYKIGFKEYKRWLWIAAAFLIAVSPYALWHYIVFGNILANESTLTFWPVTHQFLGVRFVYYGLLNFPFYEQVIRTMHNPYPTFLLFPLFLMKNFSILFVALSFLGAYLFLKQNRSVAIFLSLLLLPLFLFLIVQENWLDPNKMTYLLMLFPSIVIFCLKGVESLVIARNLRKSLLVVFIILLLLTSFFFYAINQDFPPDERIKSGRQNVQDEILVIMDFEKSRYSAYPILPDYRISSQYGSLFRKTQFKELASDFLSDNYDINRDYLPLSSASTNEILEINLSANPFKDRQWLSVSDATKVDAIRFEEGKSYLIDQVYMPQFKKEYQFVISRMQNELKVYINQERMAYAEGNEKLAIKPVNVLRLGIDGISRITVKYTLEEEIKHYKWELDVSRSPAAYLGPLINYGN